MDDTKGMLSFYLCEDDWEVDALLDFAPDTSDGIHAMRSLSPSDKTIISHNLTRRAREHSGPYVFYCSVILHGIAVTGSARPRKKRGKDENDN